MPRIIITTCGTSLLESSCWTLKDDEQNTYSLSLISQLKQRDANKNEIYAMKTRWTAWLLPFKENNDDLANRFNKTLWDANKLIDLPAELASLRAMDLYFRSQNISPITSGDMINLLVSDTNDGQFCGNVLKKILTEKLSLIADIVDVKNLDLTNSSKFTEGMEELINKINNLINSKDREVIFNLTGGYKSVTIAISGYIMAQSRRDIPIFNLYEDADKISVMTFKHNGQIEFGEYNIINNKSTRIDIIPHLTPTS